MIHRRLRCHRLRCSACGGRRAVALRAGRTLSAISLCPGLRILSIRTRPPPIGLPRRHERSRCSGRRRQREWTVGSSPALAIGVCGTSVARRRALEEPASQEAERKRSTEEHGRLAVRELFYVLDDCSQVLTSQVPGQAIYFLSGSIREASELPAGPRHAADARRRVPPERRCRYFPKQHRSGLRGAARLAVWPYP